MTGFREEVGQFYATTGRGALPLGMGCATIGGAADDETLRQYEATLEAAYARGFRYYDTSPLYGGSEFRLGKFLRGMPRDSVFVATKFLLSPAFRPEEAALHARQSLISSLERLGIETLDLFQIHDVRTLDQVLAPGGVLETLIDLRSAGRIRYFGLATREHPLLETAALHGAFDTILTYSDYTPLDQSAARVIAPAARQGVGVINGSPLDFGLLTGAEPQQNPHADAARQEREKRAIQLYRFAQERGLSMLALAMQYPLHNPDISITLTGPGSPEELEATLAACETEIPNAVRRELRDTFGVPLPVGWTA